MPQTCSSHDLCADFIAAARQVVDDAEAVHTRTHADGGYCNMPGTCGPTVWAVLHGIAAAMRDEVCVHCGEEAVRLMNGLHDVVNRKLGKPLQRPEDLAFLVQLATEEGENIRELEEEVERENAAEWEEEREIAAEEAAHEAPREFPSDPFAIGSLIGLAYGDWGKGVAVFAPRPLEWGVATSTRGRTHHAVTVDSEAAARVEALKRAKRLGVEGKPYDASAQTRAVYTGGEEEGQQREPLGGVPRSPTTQEVKEMISIHADQFPTDHEVGAPIYRCGGELQLGPLTQGNASSVDIPLPGLPGCETLGTLHSHPGGSATPSQQDIAEQVRLNYPLMCVINPDTRETTCRTL